MEKNARKNRYLSLEEASEISGYSQEYLSLRARQKKLKALKIGRNWMTTREWLDEYLKNAEIFKKEGLSDYFSLKEAAKHSNYSSDYLRLRIGQHKLKAKKIGRNWVTTKEWLDDYLERVKNYETKFKLTKKAPVAETIAAEKIISFPFDYVQGRRIFVKLIRFFQFPLFLFGQILESLAANLKAIAVRSKLRFRILEEELRVWQIVPDLANSSLRYFRGVLLALILLGASFSLAQSNLPEKLNHAYLSGRQGLAIIGEAIIQAPQMIDKMPNFSLAAKNTLQNILQDFRSSAEVLIRGGREATSLSKQPIRELSWQIKQSSFLLLANLKQQPAYLAEAAGIARANILFFVRSLPDRIAGLSADIHSISDSSLAAISKVELSFGSLRTNLQKKITELPATYADIETKNEELKIKLANCINSIGANLMQGIRRFAMNLTKLNLALIDFPSFAYDRYSVLSYQTGDKLVDLQQACLSGRQAVSRDLYSALNKINALADLGSVLGGQAGVKFSFGKNFSWLSLLEWFSPYLSGRQAYSQLAKEINLFFESGIAVKQPIPSASGSPSAPPSESPEVSFSSGNEAEIARLRQELEQLKKTPFLIREITRETRTETVKQIQTIQKIEQITQLLPANSFVTLADLTALESRVNVLVSNSQAGSQAYTTNNFYSWAPSQKIDTLRNVTISDSTLTGSSLSGTFSGTASALTVAGDLAIAGGKLTIDGVQILYLPDQTDFLESFIIGTGGGSLTNTASNEGQYNTFVGINAGVHNTTGMHNTALGSMALLFNTTGYNNVALGRLTLQANTIGANNTAVGKAALQSNISGIDNTAVGHGSMVYNTTASYNTAVGGLSLYQNIDGGENVAIGYSAMSNSTTTSENVAIGANALANTKGNENVAVGWGALMSSTGSNNVAVGYQSLYYNTSGTANTATGWKSLLYNTKGSSNSAFGIDALLSNTEGNNNSAFGYLAGYSNTTGNNMIMFGYRAGYGATPANAPATDTNGILIGYQANRSVASADSLTNYIGIGYGTLIDKSNQVKIGNSSITETILYGNLGVGTTTPYSLLSISNSVSTTVNTPLLTIASTTAGTATSTLLTVLANGFMGIGTASPDVRLHVYGGANELTYLKIQDSDGAAGLAFNPGAAGDTSWLLLAGSPAAGDFTFRETGTADYLTLKRTTGRFGIGTTTPRSLLNIAGTRPQLTITDTSAGLDSKHWFLSSQGGNLYIGTSTDALNATSTYLTINNMGHVGIGTTNPTSMLDVVRNSSSGSYYPAINIQNTNPADPAGSGYNLAFSNYLAGNGAVLGQFGVNYGQGIGLFTTSGFYITTRTAHPIMFVTGAASAERMRISATGGLSVGTATWNGTDPGAGNVTIQGNVGIGTTTPTSLLNIAGTTAPKITLSDTDASADQKHWFMESDTGSFNIGTTSDALATNSTYRALTINSTGSVGIGTINPIASLEVNSTSSAGQHIRMSNVGNNNAGLYAYSSTPTHIFSLTRQSTETGTLQIAAYGGISFVGGAAVGPSSLTSKMYLTSTGNVGIGTTTPRSLLNIAGTRPQLTITDTSAGLDSKHWFLSSQGGNLYIGTSTDALNATSTHLTINNTGNVGLGTTAPTARLTVLSSGPDTAPLGDEMIANGTFNDDLSSWDISGTGLGWVYSSAKASHSIGNTETLSQSLDLTADTTYEVSFTLSARTAGTVTLSFGYLEGSYAVTTNASYSYSFHATTTAAQAFTFTPGSTFNGSIDDVSVKAITGTSKPALFFGLLNSDNTSSIEMRSGGSSLYNTFIGYQSGKDNTTGSYNSALGYWALLRNTTGTYNTAIGYRALCVNTTGTYNTAVGYQSLTYNTIGTFNTAVGFQALYANTTGSYNTAFGYNSLLNNTTGINNVALGFGILSQNSTGSYNNGFGFQALLFNTTGSYNTAMGYRPLFSNTIGERNIALGYQPLYSNTTGTYNTAVSFQGLLYNTTGSSNSALGYQTLLNNRSATSTTVLGAYAGAGISTGYNAGELTAVGAYSLYLLQTGAEDNTALGYRSGYNVTTGANNILLGYQAGESLTTGTKNIVIGYDIDTPAIGSTNTLNIGNLIFATGLDGANTTLSTGNVGIGTTSPWGLLSVNANGLTAGTPQFVIGSSTATNFIVANGGNVGIGTTSPRNKLHVYTTSNGDGLSIDGNNYPGITLRNNGTVVGYAGGVVTGAGGWITGSSVGDIIYRSENKNILFSADTGTTMHMKIQSDGNVGIGAAATAPTHLIELDSDTYGTVTGWTDASDRNRKENFTALKNLSMSPVTLGTWTSNNSIAIDAIEYGTGSNVNLTDEELIYRLEILPISQYNFINDTEINEMSSSTVKHIGPTAQDFYKLFGLGAADTRIKATDMAGVALAGVKVLSGNINNQQLTITNLEELISDLENRVILLEQGNIGIQINFDQALETLSGDEIELAPSSIAALANNLFSSVLGGLRQMGLIVEQGMVRMQKLAASILQIDKLVINTTPLQGDPTVGTWQINVGETDTYIINNHVEVDAKIFVTPEQPIALGVCETHAQTEMVGNVERPQGFRVCANATSSQIVKFSWWIVETAQDSQQTTVNSEPVVSPSASPSTSPSPSATPSVSVSPEPTSSLPEAIISPEPSPSASPTESPLASPEPSAEASPSPTPSESPTPSPEPSPSESPLPSASPSPEPSPSPSVSPSPEPSESPSPSPSESPAA